jgi:hypothetical protein
VIERIFERPELKEQPPVLVDIGASGEIHEKWKRIAAHSICLAFDADDREMSFQEKTNSGFKKLITINRIVSDQPTAEIDFYLTASPFCSSTLEPDMNALAQWPFQDLFKVEKVVKLKSTQLADALKNAGLSYIDWMKTDTQGTDLRIFKSLPDDIRQRVVVAEFEPGIIDAYKGEDKLYQLIGYMTGSAFFMSSLDVKGVQRISHKEIASWPDMQQRAFKGSHKISPGWAEVCYINNFTGNHTSRDFLLGWLFATLEKQYAFASEVAHKGFEATNDKFFSELASDSNARVKTNRMKWPLRVVRRKMGRVFDMFLG